MEKFYTIPTNMQMLCYHIDSTLHPKWDHNLRQRYAQERSEVITAVFLKIQVFWIVMPFQLVNSY